MRKNSIVRVVYLTTLTLAGPAIAQTPLGPGFTYQGEIQRNGTPVNGTIHLRFTLWDAAGSGQPPTGGNQLGVNQLLTDVPVSDGVFTVTLNAGGEFGGNVFDGNERWLQIEVCADPGCSSLSILSPRQPLTGTPYSLRTLSAPWAGLTEVPEGFADGIDDVSDPSWSTAGANVYRAMGSVGIGTATPTSRLEISGQDGLAITGYQPFLTLRDTNSGGSQGVIQSANGRIHLRPAGAGSIPLTVLQGGSVAIGTVDFVFGDRLHVVADSTGGDGIDGRAVGGTGVWGQSVSGNGVYAQSTTSFGLTAFGASGIRAVATGVGGAGIEASPGFDATHAGRFYGDIDVTGSVLKSGDLTRIDHPLEPANKYLTHTSVEASEMKNLYDGIVVTDDQGHATVVLPDWFEALNTDFRYQLTVIGDFAQAVVAREIQNNSFEIRTEKPQIKVSWLVTGIRKDPYAKAHPLEVEKNKVESEIGKFLTPELFNQPKEKGINFRPDLVPPTDTDSSPSE